MELSVMGRCVTSGLSVVSWFCSGYGIEIVR